jgi:hypothetical protein
MSKDVLKLALEALEWITQQRTGGMIQRKATEATTAIKQALDQPVQEPVAFFDWYDNAHWGNEDFKDGCKRAWNAAIKQAAAPVQPVAMRMPKVGDRVVCIDDESLGTIVYLTAGGSPEIKFDDGSHGTYMLREFAELFGYTTPPAAQEIVCSTGLCHYRKPLTAREIELIDGMIEVQLAHAQRCDSIANRTMADKQKGWDMERVALLQKLKELHT